MKFHELVRIMDDHRVIVDGFYTPGERGLNQSTFTLLRRRLKDSLDEVNYCVDWMLGGGPKAFVNQTSEGLRRIISREYGKDVERGPVIIAAIHLGIPFRTMDRTAVFPRIQTRKLKECFNQREAAV
jgi:hypothetical protein